MENHDFRTVYCTRCGHRVTYPVRCADRFCSVCSAHRQARIRARLRAILDNVKHQPKAGLKFLTLTIPNVTELNDGLDRLIAAFRRLRNRQNWKRLVTGGAYVVEATRSETGWHVHLHVIMSALYWHVNEISKAWQAVSGGKIVWIEAVNSQFQVGYLSKYVTKTQVATAFHEEMLLAFKGRRLFTVFGDWSELARKWKQPLYACPKCHGTDWAPDYTLSGDDSARLYHPPPQTVG
jgi:ribosomal protein L37E